MNKGAMERLGVKPYDTAEHLRDDEEARLYLNACIDEAGENAAFVAKALGTVARARGAMASVAIESQLSRESLYKALSGNRDPSLSTVLKVCAALGMRLSFEPAKAKSYQSDDLYTDARSGPILFFIDRAVADLPVNAHSALGNVAMASVYDARISNTGSGVIGLVGTGASVGAGDSWAAVEVLYQPDIDAVVTIDASTGPGAPFHEFPMVKAPASMQ